MKKIGVLAERCVAHSIQLSFVLFVFLLSACSSASKDAGKSTLKPPARITDLKPTVLLISFDGFRSDYLSRAQAPHLKELARTGSIANGLEPVFPSLTFPNHYSIATGLYPEHHGIVDNEFKDPESGQEFHKSPAELADQPHWWGGEPLWVTAQKQNQIAGTFFWPGSSAEIQGVRPTYWRPYNRKVSREERVNTVLSWLDEPIDKRPTFMTLYFEDTDDMGHRYGPGSPQVMQAVEDLDATFAQLWDGLKARGIEEQLNLILVSDHGMTRVDPKHLVAIEKYIDLKQADPIAGGALLGLWPHKGFEKSILAKLKHASPDFRVFTKKTIFKRFHYNNNPRIPPILCLANEHAFVVAHDEGKAPPVGMHGYDNRLPSMQGFFLAHGPAFRVGAHAGILKNIDIYPMVSRILGLKPAKVDGRLSGMKSVLK